MIDRGVLVSTVTNAFYGVVGYGMYYVVGEFNAPAVFATLLMIGSGYHHYHLKDWSRKYDYLAMYGMLLSMIFFGLGFDTVVNIALSVGGAILIYVIGKNSRPAVGILIGVSLVLLWIKAGPVWFINAGTLAAIAFVGNQLGDSAHKDQHDFVHGLWWHIPSAAALLLAFIGFSLALGYASIESIIG